MLEVSIPFDASSGARVCLLVHPLQSARLYPSVGLGRAYAGVPQELLNSAQIGSPLEQGGGERVPPCMRRDPPVQRDAARRDGETPPHVGGRDTAAALRDEHRRFGA